MLKLDSLPPKTRAVFEHLSTEKLLQDFTLIGGTALALQLGHRNSEDLDFWLPATQLDKALITEVIRGAQEAGFSSFLATPHHQIVSARINGHDLLAFAQDFVVGGVKVTFFARLDLPFKYFDSFQRVPEPNACFKIMGLDGIFAMKAYVIHQRVRSRDIFDLKAFAQAGKTVGDILNSAYAADPSTSQEYAKSVLSGVVPLDKEDEGFDSIGITETMSEIHSFFVRLIDEYEQSIAEETLKELVCSKCKQLTCICKHSS